MQVLGFDSLFILLNALFIQIAWMSLTRRARDMYLRDLARMRAPTSRLSRYYGWKMSSVVNSVLDGILLIVILTGALVLMIDPAMIAAFIAIILFVVILTGLATVQSAFRVRHSRTREARLVAELEQSDDKISTVRKTVIPLLSAGPLADGRMWFTLYRVAQLQDPNGWAVRDVLMDEEFKEKYRNADFTDEDVPARKDLVSDDGPGIN